MRNTLFWKECRQIVRSVPFLICAAVLLLFFLTQYQPDARKIEKPQPGKSGYGTKITDDPEVIMPAALKSLYSEFVSNSYVAYPVGFYKKVKLSSSQQNNMAGILSELTGISPDMFLSSADGSIPGQTINGSNMTKNSDGSFSMSKPDQEKSTENSEPLEVTIKKNVTYEQFHTMMKQADKLVGGGSRYGDTYLSRFGAVSKTYEDALSEYNAITQEDKITGAYARLFCDNLGIVLALFPVFLAVACGMKDRRADMQELVYSRKISSFKIMLLRYAAMLAAVFLPVLLLAVCATIQIAGEYPGFPLDLAAFIKYSLVWLLPTLMVSTAIGIFFTELTGTPVGIVAQGLWWFFGLFAGIGHIDGGYGWDLILRHNMVGNTKVYLDNYFVLLTNRVSYFVFALLLFAVSICIYEYKRGGRWNEHFGFRKNPIPHRCKSAS